MCNSMSVLVPCSAVALASYLLLSPIKGHSSPLLFGPCLLWPNGRPSQLLLSTCYSWLLVRFTLCRMLWINSSPVFGPCL